MDLGARLEVRVSDVASAGHRECVIPDEQLVVHSVVEAAAPDDELRPAKYRKLASHYEGIEDSDFDVRISRFGRSPLLHHLRLRAGPKK